MKLIKRILGVLGTTILWLVITLFICIEIICHGPSERASILFATTMLESGQMKFVANWFFSKDELKKIVDNNSLKKMEEDTDESLIEVDNTNNSQDIVVEKVFGDQFEGTMMIISDPSRVFVGTTYPWTKYGLVLDKLVEKYDAIGGINGGIYYSANNEGGIPYGPVVSNGEIQNMSNLSMKGLHLIGLSKDNKLKIIDISGKNATEVTNIINNEQIRDAVCFQEESSEANYHFVKLIINGKARELNGMGSGKCSRTAIGQTKDGKILLLVTNGRGMSGSLGTSAQDLIEVFQRYDAVNAANLDGGSSSAMFYNGEYLRYSVAPYHSNTSWKLPDSFLIKR